MPSSFSCKKNVFLGFIFTLFSLILIMIAGEWDYLYSVLVIIWTTMMFYCLNQLTKRIALFCFGIAFFTFLIGRDGMNAFLHYQEDQFTDAINHHAYLSMLLALLGVWISFSFFSKMNTTDTVFKDLTSRVKLWYYCVRKYSIISFYVVYPFAILVNLAIGYFVFRYGYAAQFTDMRALIENSPVFYTLSKIELLLPATFSIFIATLPSKEQFLKILKPYLFYLFLTLGTGSRGDFILGILLIIIGLVFMQMIQPDIIWINKRKARTLFLIGLPIIAVGGTMINIVRFGDSIQGISVTDSFLNFFYDQGVSSNTIKNAYKYEENIPRQSDYYILEFLHTGLPARLLGNPVFQGNTIEHATEGGSFTHAVGYTIMGQAYLSGRGPGSSYIAELYYDFGYLGVFLGSCLYGYIFSLMNNLTLTGLFSRSVIFIILTKLLWAPRGGYSTFLSFLFAPTTVILLLLVFCSAQIAFVKRVKKYQRLKTLLD